METSGSYTPFGDSSFKADRLMNQLPNPTTASDSVRFHVPRALQGDLRRPKQARHRPTYGIDPNL
jgi:hypothetical protein